VARASRVARPFSLTVSAPALRGAFLGPDARNVVSRSTVRMNGIELGFLTRRVEPAAPHRNVIQAPAPETAIEMPQARRDDAHDRNADVRTSLVEHEDVMAGLLSERDTGRDLLMRVNRAEF